MTGVEAAVPASDLRCVLQWVPNTAEGRADRERFERAFAEVETLRAALQAVWDDVYLHETIEKLRELADRKTGYIYSDEVLTLRNAAAELERVTAALRAMIDDLIIHGNHTRWRIAKVDDALAGGARAAQGDK
jgi:hypothetical protein